MNHEYFSEQFLRIIESSPNLDLKDRVGSTGYIDFLNVSELISPLMGGYDKFNRPFITVRGYYLSHSRDSNNIITTKKPFFQTFFQRYSDGKNLWVADMGLFEFTGGLTIDQKTALLKLFETKSLTLDNIDEDMKKFRLTDEVFSIFIDNE